MGTFGTGKGHPTCSAESKSPGKKINQNEKYGHLYLFVSDVSLCHNSPWTSQSICKNDPIRLGYQEFACPFPMCTKTTKAAADCRKHILTHSGEKPFNCPKCSFACNQNSNLYRHMRN